tara:strand:- start:687 stop:1661 length:975 start_codon:yes stop_codon:yes gene_type:complete
MKILVTGCAGFIGFHLTNKLLKNKKFEILGIDNINNYYPSKIKLERLKILKKNKKFIFKKVDLCNFNQLFNSIKKFKPKYVINLAAIAGVRHSLNKPRDYINNNIVGFFNLLESVKKLKIKYLMYASSSSVYGNIKKFPFVENQNVNTPISIYAASKLSNELMAHSYSHLYKINTIGLRFFTVYGPWGRPDMALFKFVNKILKNKKIEVFNNGKMIRNFTYIDDVTESIKLLINRTLNFTKYPINEIYNIGNHQTFKLNDFIKEIQIALNKKAKISFKPLQKGDIVKSQSNQNKLFKIIKFKPKTSIHFGIKKFIEWYINNHSK